MMWEGAKVLPKNIGLDRRAAAAKCAAECAGSAGKRRTNAAEVVMGRGNPRVWEAIPLPLPLKTPTPHQG